MPLSAFVTGKSPFPHKESLNKTITDVCSRLGIALLLFVALGPYQRVLRVEHATISNVGQLLEPGAQPHQAGICSRGIPEL